MAARCWPSRRSPLYVPLNTLIAVKLGGMLERLNVAMQQAEGSYRGELTTFLRRSFHVAASRGEAVQKDMHSGSTGTSTAPGRKLNRINAGYMSFELIYNFIAARIVAYGPGLVPYMNERIGLQGLHHRRRTGQFADQPVLLVHPCDAGDRHAEGQCAARDRTAEAIENVQQPREFYRRTGRSDSATASQNAGVRPDRPQPRTDAPGRGRRRRSCSAANLRFRRGEWTFLKGESGCGKTSLIKAINGLWPYGRGDDRFPGGRRRLSMPRRTSSCRRSR